MVIIKLQGGLGNQLFQYVLARQLAIKLKTELYFDTTYYLAVRNRRFILNAFRIRGKVLPWYRKLESVLLPGHFRHVAEREYYSFDPSWYKKKGNLYLEGFWNHPEYLQKNWTEIQKELEMKAIGFRKVRSTVKKMKELESVAVHIRRTDYLSANSPGVCSIGYYEKAVKKMRSCLRTPIFYVFSDDLAWSKENLPFLSDAVFVDFTKGELEDFHLMLNCNHHIISNSTFSWWAAKLRGGKNQIVVAPTPWLSTTSPADALVLSSWNKVKKN